MITAIKSASLSMKIFLLTSVNKHAIISIDSVLQEAA